MKDKVESLKLVVKSDGHSCKQKVVLRCQGYLSSYENTRAEKDNVVSLKHTVVVDCHFWYRRFQRISVVMEEQSSFIGLKIDHYDYFNVIKDIRSVFIEICKSCKEWQDIHIASEWPERVRLGFMRKLPGGCRGVLPNQLKIMTK